MGYKLTVGRREFYGPGYDAIEVLKARGVFRDAEVTYKSAAKQVDKFAHIDIMLSPYPDAGEFSNCEYERIGKDLYVVSHDSDEGLFVEKFSLSKLRSRRGSLKLRALGEGKYEYISLESQGVTVRESEGILSGRKICNSKAEEGREGESKVSASNSEYSGSNSVAGSGAVTRSLRRSSTRYGDLKSEGIRESSISDSRDWIRARRERHLSRS